MKKVIRISIALIALTALLICCILCKRTDKDGYKDPNKKQTEYLSYTLISDLYGGAFVSITGNLPITFEQGYIVIPDEIEGYPVRSVYNLRCEAYNSDESKQHFNNIKKVYVSKNVKTYNESNMFITGDAIFIFIGATRPTTISWQYIDMYISKYHEEKYVSTGLTMYTIANINYLYNFEAAPNEGVYFVDNLNENDTFVYTPESPRRDNYTFTGWFMESECINRIDLKTFIYESSMGCVDFYAGWQEKLH